MNQHYNPVRVIFGKDSLNTLPNEIKKYGNKCLLVTQNNNEAMVAMANNIVSLLHNNDIVVDLFCDVRTNPYIKDVQKGIEVIKEGNYDAVIAVGGGSVIDTSKILCYSASQDIIWQDAFDDKPLSSNPNKLPLIAIPTTAGTGSHCTQAAVISDENNFKHTIMSYDFFPSCAIVDYMLTMSLPKFLTATTGFDAFCHLSEAYINGRLSELTKNIAVPAIKDIVNYLPKLMNDNKEEYRSIMCVADTAAGITLSNGGATVPHSFGEIISSSVYRINHGNSLAIVYPAFVEHYYDNKELGNHIKDIIDMLNVYDLEVKNGKDAKKVMINFIESLGMKYHLSDFDLTKEEYDVIRSHFESQTRFNKDDVKDIIEEICTNK